MVTFKIYWTYLIHIIYVFIISIILSNIAYGELKAKADILSINQEDLVLGCNKASTLIVEYSSLGCAHCAIFHQKNFPLIKKHIIDTCKAKYVYRELPVSQKALQAAVLAACAINNKHRSATYYYTIIHNLFVSQRAWLTANNTHSALLTIGVLHGIHKAQLTACMQDKNIANAIHNKAFEAMQVLGIKYTPTIFINGIQIKHADYNNIIAHIKHRI